LHIGLVGSKALSWRRFKTLLAHLPQEGAFKAALAMRVRAEESRTASGSSDPFVTIDDWPHSDQLLAHVIDLLSISNWQRGGGKGGKPKLLTSGAKKSSAPAASVDVRATLASIAPVQEQEEETSSE
jgi:hypothetical protein